MYAILIAILQKDIDSMKIATEKISHLTNSTTAINLMLISQKSLQTGGFFVVIIP